MRAVRWWPTGGHRGLAIMVASAALVASGAICIGVAISQQERPPEPPLSSVGSRPAPEPGPGGSDQAAPRSAASVVGPVLRPSVPVALSIPAIGVKSPMQRLGQAADGSMQVPAPGPKYDYPGWYRYSPTPGSLGPAVIVGHVDSAEHGPSVFWRLGSLRRLDKVRVTRADGSVAIFAIDNVRRFRKTRFPTQLVYGNINHAALRLITCGGPLQGGHYRDNIVVTASLVRVVA